MSENKSIQAQLKQIALEKKISQCEIARRTGMSQSNVNSFFAERHKPLWETVIKIAEALGCTLIISTNE